MNPSAPIMGIADSLFMVKSGPEDRVTGRGKK